jgi:hypothetical protein
LTFRVPGGAGPFGGAAPEWPGRHGCGFAPGTRAFGRVESGSADTCVSLGASPAVPVGQGIQTEAHGCVCVNRESQLRKVLAIGPCIVLIVDRFRAAVALPGDNLL